MVIKSYPVFSTDSERLSFCTETKIHPEFLADLSIEAYDQAHDRAHDEAQIHADVN